MSYITESVTTGCNEHKEINWAAKSNGAAAPGCVTDSMRVAYVSQFSG